MNSISKSSSNGFYRWILSSVLYSKFLINSTLNIKIISTSTKLQDETLQKLPCFIPDISKSRSKSFPTYAINHSFKCKSKFWTKIPCIKIIKEVKYSIYDSVKTTRNGICHCREVYLIDKRICTFRKRVTKFCPIECCYKSVGDIPNQIYLKCQQFTGRKWN